MFDIFHKYRREKVSHGDSFVLWEAGVCSVTGSGASKDVAYAWIIYCAWKPTQQCLSRDFQTNPSSDIECLVSKTNNIFTHAPTHTPAGMLSNGVINNGKIDGSDFENEFFRSEFERASYFLYPSRFVSTAFRWRGWDIHL